MRAYLARGTAAQFALLLAIAVLLRCDTFGDPNLDDDDTFYQAAGIAMRHGALPYVDVWDRKPFGLFAIYWAIAGISSAPIAYQLVAALFAGATAAVIAAIGARWDKPSGGLFAGLCYLLWLAPTQVAPSAPMWVKVFVLRSMPIASVWQPMPAIAIEPSGTLVELLCGQPEQK